MGPFFRGIGNRVGVSSLRRGTFPAREKYPKAHQKPWFLAAFFGVLSFAEERKYPAEGKTANHTAANLHNNLSNNVSRHIEIKGCFLHANRV